jgi:hypothetical protein
MMNRKVSLKFEYKTIQNRRGGERESPPHTHTRAHAHTHTHTEREKGFLLCWMVPQLCTSWQSVQRLLWGAYEFCQWISMPNGQWRLEWRATWWHYVSQQAVMFMHVSLWFVSSRQQSSVPLAICSQLQSVSSVFRYGAIYFIVQRVFLYDTYVKYGSAKKCQKNFWCKFCHERFPSRQTIHNLVNQLRKMGLFIDKN